MAKPGPTPDITLKNTLEVFAALDMTHDITDRKERERELSRFKRAVEASGHAIFMTDADGRITYVNPAFETITGYSESEAVGETPQILQSGEHDDEYYRDLWETVRAGEVWEGELVDRRKSGERYCTEQTIAPVTGEDGEIDRFVAVQTDVTDRKQYEQRLNETIEKLEESNERLERFAHVASHDLQEPLRMVSNYLQLIERRYADDLDEDGREFIDFAVSGADRMREMIDDLLAYSRVDCQAEPFEPTACDEVVENVLESLQVKIEETDAEIHVGSLPTVVADGNQLEQVFQNLVTNALKYCDGAAPLIEIDAERNAGEWVFRVTDNGIGIDPDRTNRIFDVFERLHSADEYSGTGIGLALCQKIVERHGGDIWVESEPGEGSSFYFTIPGAETTGDEGNPAGTRSTVAEGAYD